MCEVGRDRERVRPWLARGSTLLDDEPGCSVNQRSRSGHGAELSYWLGLEWSRGHRSDEPSGHHQPLVKSRFSGECCELQVRRSVQNWWRFTRGILTAPLDKEEDADG